ncbi:MAG: pantoate--beta-alanine ligase [Verrucomicrobiales bacterium]|nr:pantoate--beta-alanine ligase [Verrucomicrobiales bacterium]
MPVISTVADLRRWRAAVGGRMVLVPTMGALHEGHFTLVRRARELAGDAGRVLVTIFVNPLQFGPNEDFEAYPRTLEADVAGCAEAGADAVFAPPVSEVYAKDRSVTVQESALSGRLCGASRPGHFDGVATVVMKLFNLTQPTDAVFGQKDYQQLAIIRRVVRDLNVSVEIHGAETVREADGLAMSSRNRYLTVEERAQAPALRRALLAARDAWRAGEVEGARLREWALERLAEEAPLGRVDYLEVVDAAALTELPQVMAPGAAVMAAAVFFGRARLIDNLMLE